MINDLMKNWISEHMDDPNEPPKNNDYINIMFEYAIAILMKAEYSNKEIPVESTASYSFLTQALIGLKNPPEADSIYDTCSLEYILSILQKCGVKRLLSRTLIQIIYLTPYFGKVQDHTKVFYLLL